MFFADFYPSPIVSITHQSVLTASQFQVCVCARTESIFLELSHMGATEMPQGGKQERHMGQLR